MSQVIRLLGSENARFSPLKVYIISVFPREESKQSP